MSIRYMVVQRLGNTLRLPLADLDDMHQPVGSYRIYNIEKVIVNPFGDATEFIPAERDLVAENDRLRDENACLEHDIRMLNRDIEDDRSENAEMGSALRECADENDRLREAAERDADVLESLNLSLEESQAENAKLRELVRRYAEYTSQDRCEGCVCKLRCNDGEIDECWQAVEIRKMARELGIEVDE